LTSSFFDELRRCLEREFFADNFADIARIAYEAADSVDRPLAFYVLWTIFWSLDSHWRDRPLTVSTAKRMEAYLKPRLAEYLISAQAGISPEVELEHLNEIARAYRSWLAIQSQIPHGQ